MATRSPEPPAVAYVASADRSRAAGERALAEHGTAVVEGAADAAAAVDAVAEGTDCVVVEQDDEPSATDALAVLAAVREVDPAVPVVVFERETGASVAADAIDFDVAEYVREGDVADGGDVAEGDDAADGRDVAGGDDAAEENDALVAVARAAERAVTAYRAEQEVAMVNDLARTVYERITDAFFALDDDWTFTYLNAAAEDILEVDREDVLGENVWEAFPEATEYAFYPEYHRAMATQEPVTFREHFPPLGRTFEVRAFPSEDGLSVHFRTAVEGEPSRAGSEDALLELANVLSADLSASLDCVRADLAAVEEACDCEGVPVEDALDSVDRMADLVARAEELAAERPVDRPSE